MDYYPYIKTKRNKVPQVSIRAKRTTETTVNNQDRVLVTVQSCTLSLLTPNLKLNGKYC